jgi:predicted metalloendopeptidase
MAELIANLRAGLETRIAASPWMDAATKEQARAKLAAFDPRIGHPTKWIDYSTLEVKRGDLLGQCRQDPRSSAMSFSFRGSASRSTGRCGG